MAAQYQQHGSDTFCFVALGEASPPSLLAKLEQRPWQLTMGSLRASLSSQAAIFKVMYRVCEPTRYSFSKHMAFFSQPHNSRCCWRMLSLFPCDFCHCVFSKHMVQQTKTKQSYVTNKQNTYSTHRANDKWTQKVLRSYVSYLPWCPLCYPRPEPPSHSCWTLGCTYGIRVGWHWYLGASWAAKTKQMFSLPHEPHFFFLIIIN